MAKKPDTGSAATDPADEVTGDQPTPEPKPKPGDPDYDWSQHYPEGAELYTHTYPDGQVVALRRFRDIHSKQWLRSVRHLETEFDIQSAAVDRGTCDVAQALIDARPCPIGRPDDFQALWAAWTSTDSASGEAVDAGE